MRMWRFGYVFTGALFSLFIAGCGGESTSQCPSFPDFLGGNDQGGGGGDASGEIGGWDAYAGDTPRVPDLQVSEGLTECLGEPFGFGCPCTTNSECEGGFCVESVFGWVCTQECVEECPHPDYECKGLTGLGPDVVFLCLPQSVPVCKACELDAQCGDGICATIGGAKHCTITCEDPTACTAGYTCDTSVDPPVCLPPSGDCTCIAESDGALRPCEESSEYGLCEGIEACDATVGWGSCSAATPEAELCDGLDNDCNGAIDDGLGQPPVCGEGACSTVGVCLGALGWQCDAPEAIPEVCDFLDNDCDGEADEDFKEDGVYVSVNHCGTCNHDCTGTIPHATAACGGDAATPQCIVGACDEGFFQWNDYQCLPEGQQLCKPCSGDLECGGGACIDAFGGSFCSVSCDVDPCDQGFQCKAVEGFEGLWCLPLTDSCDCFVELAGAEQPCFVETEAGMCAGSQTCHPVTGWSLCNAPEPTDEYCDGLDNDCDGIPDDGLAGSEPCEKTIPGLGTCTGIHYCAGAQGWICTAPVPEMETCDYQDNDCDGVIDEDFVVGGKYANLHHCGGCNVDCEGAIPNGTAFCDTVPAFPECRVETCDPGFYPLNDHQCVPAQAVQCKPCQDDGDCYFATCVQLADGSYCLNACDADPCNEGSHCEAMAGFGDVCVPDSGTCECTEENAGATKGCSLSNDYGTCLGVETCEPASGWTVCDAPEPVPETCDGIDNDCDGMADDGLPLSEPCTNENEWGVCEGVAICQGAQGWLCQAATPGEDLCNYLDDDCDGVPDQDFVVDGKYSLQAHCGTCGNDCTGTIENGTATCDPTYLIPKCVIAECDPGFYPAGPTECLPKPDTTCEPCASDAQCLGGQCVAIDGKQRCAIPCQGDDDCGPENACMEHPDGGTLCQPVTGSCECNALNAGGKQACTLSNDLGTCVGFKTCDPVLGWSDCSAAQPVAELCNGVDDDCNGEVDDGLPEVQDCETANEFGACPGQAFCAGPFGWFCTADDPGPESCDYEDNDCDGLVDEDFKADGKYALFEHCGACNTSCAAGFPNATTKCDAAGEVPECVVDECEPGYIQINPYQCVDTVGGVCSPCAVNADCPLEGGVCTQLVDGKYCTQSCEGLENCPAGLVCQAADEGMVCVPQGGSCTCTPVTVDEILPEETCLGPNTVTLAGEGFGPGTKVYAGELEAEFTNVLGGGVLEAFFTDLPPGKYTITVSNGGICTATIPDAVVVIEEPNIYFVDPPVVYNGISIQATAYVTNIMGAGLTFFGIRPTGTQDPFTPLDFTFAPETPRRVNAVIPMGLAPGVYDVYIEDAPDCGAMLPGGLTVTDTISVNLTSASPSFGWTEARTAVNLYAEPQPDQGEDGFKSLPRAYLNPATPGVDVLAAGLGSIGFVDETRVTATVPAGLPVGLYDLVVVNPDGGVGLLGDAFRVTAAHPPVVHVVSPGSVPNNADAPVSIHGEYFFGPAVSMTCKPPAGPTVTTPSLVTSWDATTISTTLPVKGLSAGTVCLVTVTNADGAYWTWSALGITNPSENLQPMAPLSTMVTPRRAPSIVVGAATASAQFVYAVGGDDGTAAGALDTIERAPLDPFGQLGGWQLLPDALPHPWTLGAAVQAGRFIYLAGGDDGQGPIPTVLRAGILSPDDAPILDDLSLELGPQGLTEGAWYYRVSAVMGQSHPTNPGGESLPSDPLPILIPGGIPSAVVPTIHWKPLQGVVEWRVYRSPTPGLPAGSEVLVAVVDAVEHSFVDTGAVAQEGVVPRASGDLGAWHALPALNQARAGLGVAYALDPEDPDAAYLYAVGGLGAGGAPLATYEVLELNAATGAPAPGAQWTEVLDNTLAVGRWQHALFVVDAAATSHVTADEVWLFAGPGLGAGGEPVSNVDGARVLAGGLLSAWTPSSSLDPPFVGCGYAAAANQLWAFGGQNASPSSSAKSVGICGIGSGCGDLPELASWNAGISLAEARYLMGSAVGAAHILIVGGVGPGGVPLDSTEGTVW
jgi:hypothetical protein